MPTSDYLRDEWTKYAFLTTAMGTRPDSWEVALLTAADTEVAGGDDANYARQAATFETYGQVGRVRNDAAVSFPAAEVGADYTVTHFAIYAANTSEKLMEQELEFPKTITGGEVLTFGIGDLITGVD